MEWIMLFNKNEHPPVEVDYIGTRDVRDILDNLVWSSASFYIVRVLGRTTEEDREGAVYVNKSKPQTPYWLSRFDRDTLKYEIIPPFHILFENASRDGNIQQIEKVTQEALHRQEAPLWLLPDLEKAKDFALMRKNCDDSLAKRRMDSALPQQSLA
jgi:hypothetical protein